MWSQDIGISYGHKPDDENKDFIDKQIKILIDSISCAILSKKYIII